MVQIHIESLESFFTVSREMLSQTMKVTFLSLFYSRLWFILVGMRKKRKIKMK